MGINEVDVRINARVVGKIVCEGMAGSKSRKKGRSGGF